MGMVKRSPSPPEACRSQLLPDWWMQQPSAGEGRSPAPWGRCALTVIGLYALRVGSGAAVIPVFLKVTAPRELLWLQTPWAEPGHN